LKLKTKKLVQDDVDKQMVWRNGTLIKGKRRTVLGKKKRFPERP